MRELTDHTTNPANKKITIAVMDEPGMGGANHEYRVTINTDNGPKTIDINFQNGPIKEAGVNGLTIETLIAIAIDRLRGFQGGDFKCRDNAISLTHLEDALMRLQKRTRDRVAREVEGTNQI